MTNSVPGNANTSTVDPNVDEKRELYPRYKVFIHNDDATPMPFVLYVLTGIFSLDRNHAQAVMLEAHNEGLAYVGSYTLEQAEFRVDRAHTLARENKFPLTLTYEK